MQSGPFGGRIVPLISEAEKLFSPEPEVRLEKAFTDPFRNIVATAQTCYSSRGVIREDGILQDFKGLAKSVYHAGHHTTLQHAHFQFTLSNVSRQFLWSFLHSHPYYNSEQVSQRYVAVKPGSYAVPPLSGEALVVYEKTVAMQMHAYKVLSEKLFPLVKREFLKRFRVPGKKKGEKESSLSNLLQLELPIYKSAKRINREVMKKAQEVARYVLPVSALSYLYHTVSGITLLRYYRLCRQYDAPLEQRIVVEKMVRELLRFDPLYETILEEPLSMEETPEYHFFAAMGAERFPQRRARAFIEEFDESLEGRVSRLIDYKQNQEKVMAQAVREVLGLPASRLSDSMAIRWALDPSLNPLYGEDLNLTAHSKLSRALHHASYTFRKKLSHTADSQDQRHRMVPASRPCLHTHLTNDPDYIITDLILQDEEVVQYYRQTMERTWEGIARLRTLKVPDEFVLYLLPNAAAIRFTESGDLLNLRHKYAMRLCYNAQEEIWKASLDEVSQIREINPVIGRYLLPPCTLRKMAHARPICPEGERYCGVKVWQLPLSKYRRLI
jgi:thymidylate synthase ThyX